MYASEKKEHYSFLLFYIICSFILGITKLIVYIFYSSYLFYRKTGILIYLIICFIILNFF